MYKKCMILLLSGMLLTAAGCGSNNMSNSEETTEESAVDNSTADSDNAEVAPIAEAVETKEDEDIIFGNSELHCTLPKGFKQYQDEEGLYVNKNYPVDSATISYVISESDLDITETTRDEYKAQIEDGYLNDYGDKVEINITQYDKIKVTGRPGLKIMINFEFKGVEYEQLSYMFYSGNESHILNYTQEKDGKWMELFQESGDTIMFS